jgi:hypothetical protein
MSVDPSQADPGATPMVKIIHPELGAVSDVPESSLGQWYASGWTLLTEENAPPAEEPPPVPEPMSAEQVAKASSKASKSSSKNTEE